MMLDERTKISVPTKYKRQWDMESFTNPSQKPYIISEAWDGHWECSCPAWKFHTPRCNCKHITKLLANLQAIERANPRWEWLARVQATKEVEPVGVRVEKYVVRPRLLDVEVVSDGVAQRGRRL